jgi:hypothetical protein
MSRIWIKVMIVVLTITGSCAWELHGQAETGAYRIAEVPREQYEAFTVPATGAELTLRLTPSNPNKKIAASGIWYQDESDATALWYPVSTNACEDHVYQTMGTKYSSREWITVRGTLGCGTGDGSGTPETFIVDVPAVDIDIAGVAEDREETEGGYVCVGTNCLTKVTISPVQSTKRFSGKVKLTATQVGAKIRLWQDQARTQEITTFPKEYSTPSGLPTNLWVEGIAPSGALRDVELKVSYTVNGKTTEDKVKLTVMRVRITAYRPTTEGPAYNNPFQRREIPDAQEETPGAGIRVNGDDDNNNGTPDRSDTTVNNENDLIEVVLDAAPTAPSSGFKYVLKRSANNIKVWTGQNKTTALLDANNETNLTFSTTPMTVWIENPNGGMADLELQAKTDSGTVICLDKIHFYPFQAIVIGLSGEVWPGGNPLANGMYDVAQELYERGYDAHYYDEDVVENNGAGAAYDEVVRAIQHRQVTRVAIYGHSHGGGSTHDLAERLNANRGIIGIFTINFTAYVDAIQNDTDMDMDSEVRLPPGTGFHMNYFQTNDWPLVGGQVPGAIENLNVNTTQWGQNLNHGTIDDHDNVINAIIDQLIQQIQP